MTKYSDISLPMEGQMLGTFTLYISMKPCRISHSKAKLSWNLPNYPDYTWFLQLQNWDKQGHSLVTDMHNGKWMTLNHLGKMSFWRKSLHLTRCKCKKGNHIWNRQRIWRLSRTVRKQHGKPYFKKCLIHFPYTHLSYLILVITVINVYAPILHLIHVPECRT